MIVPHASSFLGHWLPQDRQEIKDWLTKKLNQLEVMAANGPIPLDPTIVALQQLVYGDAYLTKLSRSQATFFFSILQ